MAELDEMKVEVKLEIIEKVSWYQEFTHIRVVNGALHLVKSGTKVIKSGIGFLTLLILSLIAAAFSLKMFGSDEVSGRLTEGVLGCFLGLGGILGTLLAYLQKNYTKHKAEVIGSYDNGGTNEQH